MSQTEKPEIGAALEDGAQIQAPLGGSPAAESRVEDAAQDDVGESWRAREAAIALPALAAFLLVAAPVALFAERGAEFGLPVIWTYLFGAWLAMIFAAAVTAIRRRRRERAAETGR